MTLQQCLNDMGVEYLADPVKAVRSQKFITHLHNYLRDELSGRLTSEAKKAGVTVVTEATIYGSHKNKDVDIAVVQPQNGPLVWVGVRSQMSSIGKNVLTYYQDIIGECIGIQDRFPMAVAGYVYLHPLVSIKPGKASEIISHGRYAKMYSAITGRGGRGYQNVRGVYDEFAYMVVDFNQSPPAVDDSIVRASVPHADLSVTTFVDRIVSTFNDRHLFQNFFT